MPVDSRIVWKEDKGKGGTKVTGTLNCDFCGHSFSRDSTTSPTKNAWKIKETISNEIGQHKHG